MVSLLSTCADWRVSAKEFKSGMCVRNLGIAAKRSQLEGAKIELHAENVYNGNWSIPNQAEADADLYQCRKRASPPCQVLRYESSQSFSTIRGGHIDFNFHLGWTAAVPPRSSQLTFRKDRHGRVVNAYDISLARTLAKCRFLNTHYFCFFHQLPLPIQVLGDCTFYLLRVVLF
jgi:hypothetical protein